MTRTINCEETLGNTFIRMDIAEFVCLVENWNTDFVFRLKDINKLQINGKSISGFSKGIFYILRGNSILATDTKGFEIYETMEEASDAFSRGGTGFSNFDQLIEPFNMGITSKKGFNDYKASGYTDPKQFLKAYDAGFKKKTIYNKANKLTIKTKQEYDEFNASKFTQVPKYRDAKSKGFKVEKEFDEAKKLGIDQYSEFTAFKKSGFFSITDYRDAKANGFTTEEDYKTAKKHGFPNAQKFAPFKKLNDEFKNFKQLKIEDLAVIIQQTRDELFEKLIQGKVKVKLDGDYILFPNAQKDETLIDVITQMKESWELSVDIESIDWNI
jgi:hypothetical protein